VYGDSWAGCCLWVSRTPKIFIPYYLKLFSEMKIRVKGLLSNPWELENVKCKHCDILMEYCEVEVEQENKHHFECKRCFYERLGK
jgi:hypothetical protein